MRVERRLGIHILIVQEPCIDKALEELRAARACWRAIRPNLKEPVEEVIKSFPFQGMAKLSPVFGSVDAAMIAWDC